MKKMYPCVLLFNMASFFNYVSRKNIKFYIDNHISALFYANFQCIGSFFVPATHLAVPHQPKFRMVALISVQFFTLAPEILSKLSGTKKKKKNYFMINFNESHVAEVGFKLATPESAVNMLMEPGIKGFVILI